MSKDKNSFIDYYNKFKDKIFAYFFYRVGFDRRLAEDLTSEVFIRAFKGFDGFDNSKSFQAWIFTISHNHLINHYKAAKSETSLTEVENMIGSSGVDIDNTLELERVVKIINNMGESDREPLLLRYIEGLNNNEIAEALGKEEGAVRTQISRSLVKLRKILKY